MRDLESYSLLDDGDSKVRVKSCSLRKNSFKETYSAIIKASNNEVCLIVWKYHARHRHRLAHTERNATD